MIKTEELKNIAVKLHDYANDLDKEIVEIRQHDEIPETDPYRPVEFVCEFENRLDATQNKDIILLSKLASKLQDYTKEMNLDNDIRICNVQPDDSVLCLEKTDEKEFSFYDLQDYHVAEEGQEVLYS